MIRFIEIRLHYYYYTVTPATATAYLPTLFYDLLHEIQGSQYILTDQLSRDLGTLA